MLRNGNIKEERKNNLIIYNYGKETLNGFEIFEDFMPGGNVFKTETSTGKEDTKNDIDDSASEPLTDEELENYVNQQKITMQMMTMMILLNQNLQRLKKVRRKKK